MNFLWPIEKNMAEGVEGEDGMGSLKWVGKTRKEISTEPNESQPIW